MSSNLPKKPLSVLTKEQFEEISEFAPKVLDIGLFDPVLLKDFVDMVLEIPRPHNEKICIFSAESNKYASENPKGGALVAVIKTDPVQYIGVMSLSEVEQS